MLTEPAPELVQGCCSYGAHFSDKTDRDHVVKVAKKLTDDEWQFAVGRTPEGHLREVGKETTASRNGGPASSTTRASS